MPKPEDCFIGMEFGSDGGRWRCSDVGKRTVVAIKLNAEDSRDYSGPFYMVVEDAMDENDLQTCYATKKERDNNFPDVDDGPDLSRIVRYQSGQVLSSRDGEEDRCWNSTKLNFVALHG